MNFLRRIASTISKSSGYPLNGCGRTLYTAEALGVDKFLYSQEKITSQFVNSGDKFRAKMKDYASSNEHMIFTEDLKNMAHLVQSAEDFELIEKMMKKFNSQNKELRFGNYVFGPVIMRMYHVLKNDDAALKVFLDKEMDGFFDQMMSYQILLDLLYVKGRYADVRSTYDIIKQRQLEGARYPKHCMVLVLGACYKENTPESFQYSKDLWKGMTEAGHIPMRKAATFAAGLALMQKAPHIALEIISGSPQQNYVTVRNIKIQALIDLNRLEDAVPLLRSILEVAPTGPNKQQTIAKDVVENVKNAIAKSDNADLKSDFIRIEKYLREHEHISDNTLDELLSKGMENRSVYEGHSNHNSGGYGNNNRRFNNNNNRGGFGKNTRTQRPGLRELY